MQCIPPLFSDNSRPRYSEIHLHIDSARSMCISPLIVLLGDRRLPRGMIGGGGNLSDIVRLGVEFSIELSNRLTEACRPIAPVGPIACGAPDLAVLVDDLMVGHVAAKDVGTSLDAAARFDHYPAPNVATAPWKSARADTALTTTVRPARSTPRRKRWPAFGERNRLSHRSEETVLAFYRKISSTGPWGENGFVS